ncbi:MAG: Zn(2+)-responsive transcriptional regulator [Candidatus Poribacteria bacterium]|nr:Zn(2+)-responsive transcriptional regulator [Candidatus Poribacteria bacterium]
MNGLKIGRVAEIVEVSVDTIRFYERRGLLPEPDRTDSGYRVYARGDVRRLRFIKKAQEIGFSLNEIAELLALRTDDRKTCEDVQRRVQTKIAVINERIIQLEAFRRALSRLEAACTGDSTPASECPVIEALDDESVGSCKSQTPLAEM